MTLNPIASTSSHNWNYSRPNEPGYSTSIVGTVAAIQEVQAMNFGDDGKPSTPAFWENTRQPKMNIRLVLVGPSGGFRTWTIQPASKAAKEGKKKSVHIDLFKLAGGVDVMNLIGKTIRITTEAPPNGFNYGRGNPRPWHVELVTDVGPYQLAEPLDPIYLMPRVLADMAVSGGMIASMNQPQQPEQFAQQGYQQSAVNPMGQPAQAQIQPAMQQPAQPPMQSATLPHDDDIPF